ncbi:hypothetical protein CAOG_01654 [Capsaspora owczarzaki ATCC 30864]|uniref:DNA polymerase lambda n=1 Tax=Capsaspora owczarzaki (strain ATCC 30864) TaxID=595528 RepID=A0A0D2U5A1_CAPO3|nr:hypothetical protein CAOG_01654 [Capsaspora owczarzaki ATCC 30864]KJE90326.1 hypothetical protein CAOG_001654 [Capsaspora owczarzaki ATCC 30864]|eukprot:XP_004364522.1 hypothetical protein CAOG_01654 [Capsaspora owczarzaki ATCC 30864]
MSGSPQRRRLRSPPPPLLPRSPQRLRPLSRHDDADADDDDDDDDAFMDLDQAEDADEHGTTAARSAGTSATPFAWLRSAGLRSNNNVGPSQSKPRQNGAPLKSLAPQGEPIVKRARIEVDSQTQSNELIIASDESSLGEIVLDQEDVRPSRTSVVDAGATVSVGSQSSAGSITLGESAEAAIESSASLQVLSGDDEQQEADALNTVPHTAPVQSEPVDVKPTVDVKPSVAVPVVAHQIFTGVRAFVLASGTISQQRKALLESKIVHAGGTTSVCILPQSTTHIIVGSDLSYDRLVNAIAQFSPSTKVKLEVPASHAAPLVLSADWVTNSLVRGRRLPDEDFVIRTGPTTSALSRVPNPSSQESSTESASPHSPLPTAAACKAASPAAPSSLEWLESDSENGIDLVSDEFDSTSAAHPPAAFTTFRPSRKSEVPPAMRHREVSSTDDADSSAEDTNASASPFSNPKYVCFLPVPRQHSNMHITDQLACIEDFYFLSGDESRALAMRRSLCVIAALPRRLTRIQDIQSLHNMGQSSRAIVKEILDKGRSTAATCMANDPKYTTMLQFRSIYGCGQRIAQALYERGYRTIAEICADRSWVADFPLSAERLEWGLTLHTELGSQVPRDEVKQLGDCVYKYANTILPGVMMTIGGGYRRGKPASKDCDFIFTHNDSDAIEFLLPQLLLQLQVAGLVVHANTQVGHNTPERIINYHYPIISDFTHRPLLDCTDRSFTIFKSPVSGLHRRIDIICVPRTQYAYTVLAWTGSKQFNRSLRLYAERELGWTLSSHGLLQIYSESGDSEQQQQQHQHHQQKSEQLGRTHNGKQVSFVPPVLTERQVFAQLKVPYLEPWQRNH